MSDLLEGDAPPGNGPGGHDRGSSVLSAGSGRVGVFDLNRQEGIERARLRGLQPILETIAHRIGSVLTSAIRQPAYVEFVSFDQKPWEQHSVSLPDPTFVSSAVLLPLEGRVVLHLPVEFMLKLLDFYLGGDGSRQPDRDALTEIERALLGSIVDIIWNEVPPPFATLVAMSVALVQSSTSAPLLQVGRPGVMCLVVDMSVLIGDQDPTTIQLAMPLTVMLPLIEQIERARSSDGMAGQVDKREARRRILAVPIELKVSYPTIGLTPDELLSLRVGDVIDLAQEIGAGPTELQLVVQDTPFGTGVLVENGSKLACTVVTKKETQDE